MNKRAIAILGAIFILIVGTLGFLIFRRNSSEDEIPTPAPIVEETPPESEPEPESTPKAVRLTDEPVVSPILFFQGNGISYFNSQGQLFQTDLQISDGTALLSGKRELSIALKSNISKIHWPLNGNNFIAEFNSANRPTWSVYETSKAKYTDLPSQVYSFSWLPTGDRIVYVWIDAAGKATLNVANADTSAYQKIADLFQPDNVVYASPDGQNIAFHRTQNNDVTTNVINIVSIDGKKFTGIVKDGYNSGVLWSPDSRKFLFGKRDSGAQEFSLWVADITTGEIRSLGVQGAVSKAVWSRDSLSVYAGVPNTGIAGQGLTQDTIFKVDVGSGQQQQYDPGLPVDARDMFLSSDQSLLFFLNAQDNSIYYISVK